MPGAPEPLIQHLAVTSPRKPSGGSLSRTTENVNSPQSDSALKTPHICAGHTLL